MPESQHSYTLYMNKLEFVDCYNFRFAFEFDTHQELIYILPYYKTKRKFIWWIEAFLQNKTSKKMSPI